MKSRITAIALCVSMVLSLPFSVLAAEYATRGETADMLLNAADDYNPSVRRSDIIKGYEDGELHEDWSVTRAEALVMLERAFGLLPKPTGHNARVALTADDFSDIPQWADDELKNVFDSGIVAGTADGIFSPYDNVTKEQLEIFIKRVYSLYGTNEKDDFYAAVNKDILNNIEIKPGRVIAGTLFDLADESTANVSKIINEVTALTYEKGTKEQKISDMYKSIMDKDTRNKVGIEPIKKYLDMADAAENTADLVNLQKTLFEEVCVLPYTGFMISVDPKDSRQYVLGFSCFTPSMSKSIYTAGTEVQTEAYLKYLRTLLMLGGENEEDARKHAKDYYDFEKQLAEVMLNNEDYANIDKVYNVYTLDEIDDMFENIDIKAVFDMIGLKREDKIIIRDVELIKKFAQMFNNDNIDVLKTAAKVSGLMSIGGVLNDDFIKASEVFNQEMLGVSGSYTDEERAAMTLQSIMPEYIGKIYAEKYFDEQSKKDVENMIYDIISVYRERIDSLDWMSDETKEKAKKKLETMNVKVGYPDKWDTYLDNVEITGDSYFENIIRISKAQYEWGISLQGTTVDKTRWAMYPFTVNACYVASSNDITFPAAILQPPMYDKNASYEENLGAIGYFIAHEITHAFDNNGAKYDENGNAANWWTEEDYAAFESLCEKVVEFYDGQEGIPGVPMNGRLTLSENVADLGAAACLTEVVSRMENPDYKKLYTSMAKTWAASRTRAYSEYLRGVDVHSDEKIRVNCVLPNLDEFYDAFGITEGDGMYVAPENRVKIW